jgi:DNA-binding transcriptional LysR family regulator
MEKDELYASRRKLAIVAQGRNRYFFDMAIDVKSLHYFIAVAEEGNFTRAAERLDMRQPPLSRQIKLLEQELDAQLFRRKPRGVELTSAGRVLLGEAKETLGRLDRGLEATRRTARGEEGRLSVGIAPTAPFHPLVPRSIRAYREAYPGVSLTLWEGLSNEVIGRFSKDEMDVAFVRAANHLEVLRVTRLLDEPMIAALPSQHPMAQQSQGKAVPLSQLSGDPFIIIGPPGTGIHDETIAACRKAGFSPRIGQQAPRITSTLGLVAAGLGVAIVPESMERMTMDGVVFRQLSGAQPTAFLGLASRRGETSPLARQFLRLVMRIAKQR